MPPTRTRPPQLLIASHNHGAGSELLQLAERRGYAVRRAHSGAQALEQAHAAPPDLVVLDESLTDMDAFAATTTWARAPRSSWSPPSDRRRPSITPRCGPASGNSCAIRSTPKRSPPSSTPTYCLAATSSALR